MASQGKPYILAWRWRGGPSGREHFETDRDAAESIEAIKRSAVHQRRTVVVRYRHRDIPGRELSQTFNWLSKLS